MLNIPRTLVILGLLIALMVPPAANAEALHCPHVNATTCGSFFLADDQAHPAQEQQITATDLTWVFHVAQRVHNTQEDWWLIHPTVDAFAVVDIGAHSTDHAISGHNATVLGYLSDTRPDWFVLLHPHPATASRHPSSADIHTHWQIENDLSEHGIDAAFVSVVVFDGGYFIFSPTERTRNRFQRMSENVGGSYIDTGAGGANGAWMEYQFSWSLLASRYDMAGSMPDYPGYSDAVSSQLALVYANNARDTTATLLALLAQQS